MRLRMVHGRRQQRGSVLILVVIAAAALIGIAGLALDASRIGYMKARLQSVVDAVALAAAKRLDETGSTISACEAARLSLIDNAEGFKELAESLPSPVSCGDIDIQYSSVIPFDPTQPGVKRYVRVFLGDIVAGASLSQALGFTTLEVSASAVAGPSAPLAEVCSVLPIAVCGTAAKPNFGFEPGRVYVLKGKQKFNEIKANGDFFLLTLLGSGGDNLRVGFAGGFNSCLDVSKRYGVKSGENVGPVAQGINTRFNEYASNLTPANFPPDVLWKGTGQPPDPSITLGSDGILRQGSKVIVWGTDVAVPNRTDYLNRLASGSYDSPPLPAVGGGVPLRREVAVPIANCEETTGNEVKLRGAGCFFLLQKMAGSGSESQLFGEFLPDCKAIGTPGPDPGSGGPYVIQLFRDPNSSDS
jgi:hypothetical protein